jgi:glycosyltransferase involved in cell wall biosynthesis
VLRGDNLKENIDLMQQIKVLNVEENIIFLPRLDENELPVLYSSASALVFPSLYEGGGIPVMEAMACECPIIASNIPTTIEFANTNAILFDPLDVNSIMDAMKKFINQTPISNFVDGFDRVKNHRPDNVIRNFSRELIKL